MENGNGECIIETTTRPKSQKKKSQRQPMGLQHRKIIQHPLTVSPYAEMCNSSTKIDVTLNFEPYKYGGGKHVL